MNDHIQFCFYVQVSDKNDGQDRVKDKTSGPNPMDIPLEAFCTIKLANDLLNYSS